MESDITTPTKEVTHPNPDYVKPVPDEFGNIPFMTPPETVTVEVPVSSEDRANFLNEQYKKLKRNLRTQLEYGIAKGSLIIKPYIVFHNVAEEQNLTTNKQEAEIMFDYVQADCFYPLAFDGSSKMTEAAFIQQKTDKDTIYTRLEYHVLNGNSVRITNKAYKSTNTRAKNTTFTEGDIDLGQEIKLSDVPEWADLQEETIIKNVDRLMFGYFKMPDANTIDSKSPLGVSGFSRAVGLIKEADLQFSRLQWEYEGGELAIDIDRDALMTNEDGKGHSVTVNPRLQQRLFRSVDLGTSDTYQPYSPALRDTSYINGLNNILMRIEDVCALSRGTISDVAAEARTATELKILKQRSYSANAEIQKALEDTLKDVIYVMDVYCTLYNITPPGQYDVSFEWDDSILVDIDTELNKRLTLLNAGLTSKLETRAWYFGETEQQAAEALQKVKEETTEDMETEVDVEMNKAAQQARMQGLPAK
jgi:A118 family predicted phage portal protein